jgi:phasin family protein
MTQPAEQFLANAKTTLASLTDLAATSLAGFEKLVALNLATAKSAIADSAEQLQAAASVKSPQDLSAVTGLVQPAAEKAAAYGRAVAAIVTETSTALAKTAEGQLAEVQAQAVATIEATLKHAPAGSETAVAAFKTALANGQKALETAQAQARQAAKAVEKSLATATDLAVKSTKTK